MIFNNLKNSFVSAAAFLVLAGTAAPVLAAPVKNIVLVHGAFVDGSGWKPVHDILVKDGYGVTVVQDPLTSLEEDVAATKRILDGSAGRRREIQEIREALEAFRAPVEAGKTTGFQNGSLRAHDQPEFSEEQISDPSWPGHRGPRTAQDGMNWSASF
jgi:hypothetical protein